MDETIKTMMTRAIDQQVCSCKEMLRAFAEFPSEDKSKVELLEYQKTLLILIGIMNNMLEGTNQIFKRCDLIEIVASKEQGQ